MEQTGNDIVVNTIKVNVKSIDLNHAFKIRSEIPSLLQNALEEVVPVFPPGLADYFVLPKISVSLKVSPDASRLQLIELLSAALQKEILGGMTDSGLRKEKSAEKFSEALLVFLKTGRLPWWFQQTSFRDELNAFVITKPRLVSSVVVQMDDPAPAISRLLLLLDNDSLTSLLISMFSVQETWISQWVENSSVLWKVFSLPSREEFLKRSAKVALELISKSAEELPFQSFFQSFVSESKAHKKVKAQIRKILSEKTTRQKQTGFLEELLSLTEFKMEEKKILRTEIASEKVRKKTVAEESPVKEQDALFIDNAGIIILHPFIAALFSELKLLDKDNSEFRNERCRTKALFVLNYLVKGNEQMDEWTQTFNKAICGIVLEEAITEVSRLTKKEKKECDNLLESVVGHWNALGKSSGDALREGFLQRTGKIYFKNDRWQLIVEQKTLDVLLEKLPWGYSMVKFPWMPYFIYTQW